MEFDHIWRVGDAAPTAAVAIARMPQGHTHVGIIYREGDGSDRLRLLHLAFHKILRDDPISPSMDCPELKCRFLCVVPAIEEEDAINVAIYCRGIARHHPELPYGLSYNDEGCFEVTEESAELRLPEERRWLNCSTFVLTVFKSAGPKLVDPTGWPNRPEEDRRWQAKLVRWLWPEAGCRHIKRVLPDIGRARIRPEETTGAYLEAELPAFFGQCEPNGKVILSLLDGTTRVAPRSSPSS
jgi:hypothetical protein